MGLAISSSLIAAFEGVLYHWNTEGGLLKVLLIIENTIKAFTFRPTISLENAQSFINAEPGLFRAAVGYLYMLVIFIAPYCTFSAAYKLIDRFLRVRRHIQRIKRASQSSSSASTKTLKTLLKSLVKSRIDPKTGQKTKSKYSDCRIILVTSQKLSDEQRLSYLKDYEEAARENRE